MSNATPIALNSIDPDDLSEVLSKIETSFGFSFGYNELKDVNSLDELCSIITNKVQGNNTDDCTTQQAFYKLRNAIAAAQFISKDSITTSTNLQELFPRQGRRQKIKDLQAEMGMHIKVLDIASWLGWILTIGMVCSLAMFFYNWKLALGGVIFFTIISRVAYTFLATEFKVTTVGQWSELLTVEHYLKSRHNPSTINRDEVARKVKDLFKQELNMEDDTSKTTIFK